MKKTKDNDELKLFPSENKYKLPNQFKGKVRKNGGLTRYDPREWTKREIDWALKLKEKGFTINQIAECLDRDSVGVSIKMKRLKKQDGQSYNEKHRKDKYITNKLFIEKIKPKIILDAYAGKSSYYKDYSKKNNAKLITNDISEEFSNTYNMEAFKLLCKLYSEDEKFDIIDLDPFGSCYECIDIATKMIKRGIIITFGEYGHKRWKRLDFVQNRYYINNMEEFNVDALIKKTLIIAKGNKTILNPLYITEWTNICRVYFEVVV